MEQVLAASKQSLISSLEFGGPPPAADYCTSRNSITIFPSGGNQYGPTGVKQIRFNLTTSSGGFIDLASLAIQARVSETGGTAPLTLLGPNLGCMISELRVYAGGVLVEAVPHYNRTEELLSRFQSHDKRIQQFDEGFGYLSGDRAGAGWASKPIPAGGSKTVVWSPSACGLCAQKNYLPSQFLPGGATLELLLVNTSQECVDTSTSALWQLSDVRCLVDVINCDPSFTTSLSRFLLGGSSLTLSFKSHLTTMYTCAAPNMQLISARSHTRMNQTFLHFDRAASHTHTKKTLNYFYLSPNGQDLSLRSQVGDVATPDMPCDNMSQFWFRLLHCVGLKNSPSHTPCISYDTYRSDAFCAGIDWETVPEATGSGISTHGAPQVLDIRNIGTDANDLPTTAFLTVVHENLIQISQDGVVLAN
jgi:hypothetical protein